MSKKHKYYKSYNRDLYEKLLTHKSDLFRFIEVPVINSEENDSEEKHPSKTAIIYRSEWDYISCCILERKHIETGGQLFGFWTTAGVPVILYVLGPGKNANHQSTFFVQDTSYLQTVGNILISEYGLQHIGEWHSHHQMRLDHPSGHDAETIITNMKRYNMRRCVLCIGNCNEQSSTLNAYTFHENCYSQYVHASWDMKEMDSPFRPIVDTALKDLLLHPVLYRNNKESKNVPQDRGLFSDQGYCFSKHENRLVLKKILDYITEQKGVSPKVALDNNGLIHITSILDRPYQKEKEEIFFPKLFPEVPPVIESFKYHQYAEEQKEVKASYDRSRWFFDGDIFNSFINYYSNKEL